MQVLRNLMQMSVREAPKSSIQKFNVWEKISKTNIQEEPQILLKKLELLHPALTQHHRGKSPITVASAAKQRSSDRDKETEDLRNQIKLFKQKQKERDT